MLCERAGFAGLAAAQDTAIQRAHLFDAAQDTGQSHAVILRDTTAPAFFVFQRNQVQTFCHFVGHALQVTFDRAFGKCTGNRRLFQDVPRVMRWKRFQNPAQLTGVIDHAGQIGAADFLAVALAQHGAVDALIDQVIFHGGLIFQVHFGLAARHFVQRRLRDIQVTAFDQLGHLTIEERQQ